MKEVPLRSKERNPSSTKRPLKGLVQDCNPRNCQGVRNQRAGGPARQRRSTGPPQHPLTMQDGQPHLASLSQCHGAVPATPGQSYLWSSSSGILTPGGRNETLSLLLSHCHLKGERRAGAKPRSPGQSSVDPSLSPASPGAHVICVPGVQTQAWIVLVPGLWWKRGR